MTKIKSRADLQREIEQLESIIENLQSPRSPGCYISTPEELAEAMQAVWEAHCKDTGCAPAIVEYEEGQYFADFTRDDFSGCVFRHIAIKDM